MFFISLPLTVKLNRNRQKGVEKLATLHIIKSWPHSLTRPRWTWWESRCSCFKRRSLSITDYRDLSARVSILAPDVLEPGAGSKSEVGFEVDRQDAVWPVLQDLTSDLATSPLGLLLLQELLALFSPPLVDGVARVVDLEGVLVVHVGILDFSALLIKLQNVGHPKSEGERRGEFKEQQLRIH